MDQKKIFLVQWCAATNCSSLARITHFSLTLLELAQEEAHSSLYLNNKNNVFKDGIGVKGLRFKIHGNKHGNYGSIMVIIMVIIMIIMVIIMVIMDYGPL